MRTEQLWIPITNRKRLSLNEIYSGIHYQARRAHKNKMRKAVAAVLKQQPIARFDKPVALTFTATLGKGIVSWDISNHGYLIKLVEDALVKQGVLVNDTQRHVQAITTLASIRDLTRGNGVWVEIREV